jgi:hypothetical protein
VPAIRELLPRSDAEAIGHVKKNVTVFLGKTIAQSGGERLMTSKERQILLHQNPTGISPFPHDFVPRRWLKGTHCYASSRLVQGSPKPAGGETSRLHLVKFQRLIRRTV